MTGLIGSGFLVFWRFRCRGGCECETYASNDSEAGYCSVSTDELLFGRVNAAECVDSRILFCKPEHLTCTEISCRPRGPGFDEVVGDCDGSGDA